MKKINKGKLIGVVAASLSAVSLMGVGFASWVLTGTNNMDSTGNITVNVGDVEDKRVLIQSAQVDTDNNTVAFDANSKGSGDLGIEGTGDQAEDRTFALTYVVRVPNGTGAWNVKAQLTGNADNYKTAVNEKKYITMPAEIGLDAEIISVSSDSTDQAGKLTITKSTDSAKTGYTDWTVNQTFEFCWGAAFAGKNPVDIKKTDSIFVDVDGATSTVKADADKVVTNINGLKGLSLSNFTITLTTYIGK